MDLPFVALIDTTVFLCRIGDKPCDEHADACIDFCNRMTKAGREICVAAPTITEVTRHRGKQLPRVQGIQVVAFDYTAATQLGMKMPITELKAWRDESGRSLGHVKYDALIVGCALRVPSCAFVGMDKGQLALARHVGLAAFHPTEFFTAPQSALSAPVQQPLLPSS